MKIELIRLIVAGNAMSVQLRTCVDKLRERGELCTDAERKLVDWHEKLKEYAETNDLPNLMNPDLIKNDKRFL